MVIDTVKPNDIPDLLSSLPLRETHCLLVLDQANKAKSVVVDATISTGTVRSTPHVRNVLVRFRVVMVERYLMIYPNALGIERRSGFASGPE